MSRFLALGDSYTIGEGVAPAERWPARLVQLLRARGITIDEPHYVAQTAWTTDELSEAIVEADLPDDFRLVSLMIGVNDQYRSRPVEEFAKEFGRLLRRATRFAGRRRDRVLVLSIPDWGVTPFAKGRDRAAIGREIDVYNTRARAMAEAAHARWVDVTPSSREMLDRPHLLIADGLHPSGAMYDVWARVALPAAEAMLRP